MLLLKLEQASEQASRQGTLPVAWTLDQGAEDASLSIEGASLRPAASAKVGAGR